jgi:hypothetical protein
MTGNLKILGVAIAMVLVMSTGTTAMSQAAEFTAGEYPATVTGEQVEGVHKEHGFVWTIHEFRCKTAHFIGGLSKSSGTISLAPTFGGCGTGNPVTIKSNGCEFVLHVLGGGEDTHEGSFDIVCPAGKVIEFLIYSNSSLHTAGFSSCVVTVFPKTGIGTVQVVNNTEASPDDIRLVTTLKELKYETHGFSLCGPFTVPAENLLYFGETTLKAFQGEGKQIALTAD